MVLHRGDETLAGWALEKNFAEQRKTAQRRSLYVTITVLYQVQYC